MNVEELNMEQQQLIVTTKEIEEILEEEKMRLSVLLKKGNQNDDSFWDLVRQREIHIANLENLTKKPYFARIDFTDSESGKKYKIYIGKNGVSKDSNIIVVDWRAPISSLYYDSDIGESSYESPDGKISGNLDLKRQYEIEDKKLIDYIDVDLVANDELLQKYLNANNEARLKNIVSTIQKEQNSAIRQNIDENIIVQGVAGSGKTTVALHRIAYLIYNNMKRIKQNQYMVIGPNTVFLKYIQSVLPDLDVSGVEQYTYEDFAIDYIGSKISVNPSDSKVTNNIENGGDYSIEKYKCSIEYKYAIDKFLSIYKSKFFSQDLMLGDVKLLDKDTIKRNFELAENINSNLTYKQIIDITIDRLCNVIDQIRDNINGEYTKYSNGLFAMAKNEKEKEKLRKEILNNKKEIEKNCRGIIKKYFDKISLDPIKVYKLFISSCDEVSNFNNIKKLQSETLKSLKISSCDFEDLPALIYLKSRLCSNEDYSNIRHIVVDEAQDLGDFCFMALKCALPKATFSIFGDLAQSIYDYRSIEDWNGVNKLLFNEDGILINFNKSYRTTAEIMELADTIAESINLNKSEEVIRHGSPVNVSKISVNGDIVNYIINKINFFKQKGYKSIAIISKTDSLSRKINEELLARNINIPNVGVNDDLLDEKFRICTISNQLAKGLEFDAVIINNASEDVYSSTSKLDMKLLYVAVTRALHELDITYIDELSKPIDSYIKRLSIK